MIKRKRKPFFRILFILLAIELVIVLIDAFFAKGDGILASITEPIITVISLPIGLISPNLPFYSGEGIPISILFWVINTAIQAAAIYVVFRMFKRLK